ncbi:transporter [Candidatus Gottesmanbacteria bacterium RBG_13_37_7]|uniref:Transporter n=1 Tax=Candidatus Gottesmanbacteria bacterium RBG_13_37_7 TaxID=1798369 RepID=A0A1F5YID6_9BACT|nr:MAG: transporter [Candidatus Gottesmanbacteria bacterium RBG_13_37_7]
MKNLSLTKFALISIAAAVITITLKSTAYFLTGSISLLSDAVESLVNLATAIMAFYMLRLMVKLPDEQHLYGHSKAEYFSSVFEGILILLAAITIIYSAVNRLLNPYEIEFNIIGLGVSALASLVNFMVAQLLYVNAKKHKSITLEADAQHLMTDVWTSAGVLLGIGFVFITKMQVLDPVIAILVALNIVNSGWKLIYRSAMGFMDEAIPEDEKEKVVAVLRAYENKGIKYHGFLTRQSGMRRFISLHLLVPGNLTIQKGHNLAEEIEKKIISVSHHATVITHIEPIEDKKSLKDISLDRD